MAHLYRYRGRRVRPLTPGERRQLAIAATATGLAVLPLAVAVVTAVSSGEHQLVVLLVRSATLLFVTLKGPGASSRSRALSDVTITDRPARSI